MIRFQKKPFVEIVISILFFFTICILHSDQKLVEIPADDALRDTVESSLCGPSLLCVYEDADDLYFYTVVNLQKLIGLIEQNSDDVLRLTQLKIIDDFLENFSTELILKNSIINLENLFCSYSILPRKMSSFSPRWGIAHIKSPIMNATPVTIEFIKSYQDLSLIDDVSGDTYSLICNAPQKILNERARALQPFMTLYLTESYDFSPKNEHVVVADVLASVDEPQVSSAPILIPETHDEEKEAVTLIIQDDSQALPFIEKIEKTSNPETKEIVIKLENKSYRGLFLPVAGVVSLVLAWLGLKINVVGNIDQIDGGDLLEPDFKIPQNDDLDQENLDLAGEYNLPVVAQASREADDSIFNRRRVVLPKSWNPENEHEEKLKILFGAEVQIPEGDQDEEKDSYGYTYHFVRLPSARDCSEEPDLPEWALNNNIDGPAVFCSFQKNQDGKNYYWTFKQFLSLNSKDISTAEINEIRFAYEKLYLWGMRTNQSRSVAFPSLKNSVNKIFERNGYEPFVLQENEIIHYGIIDMFGGILDGKPLKSQFRKWIHLFDLYDGVEALTFIPPDIHHELDLEILRKLRTTGSYPFSFIVSSNYD
jgi:hypothetical protein